MKKINYAGLLRYGELFHEKFSGILTFQIMRFRIRNLNICFLGICLILILWILFYDGFIMLFNGLLMIASLNSQINLII